MKSSVAVGGGSVSVCSALTFLSFATRHGGCGRLVDEPLPLNPGRRTTLLAMSIRCVEALAGLQNAGSRRRIVASASVRLAPSKQVE
jgi:hypothetical protein